MRPRPATEGGFTLIELLVVLVVIGILAALALPSFISQRDKAADAGTKSDLRSLQTYVEACATETNDYSKCTTEAELDPKGIPYGSGQRGKVWVEDWDPGLSYYLVIGLTPEGHEFSITKTDGVTTRMCANAGRGGCPADSRW